MYYPLLVHYRERPPDSADWKVPGHVLLAISWYMAGT